MDNRLYLASVKGDVHTLHYLIHENPLILEKATVGRLDQNPLHIAASVGQLEFTRALLSRDTNLATKSDSRGCFPLHLASEKGHVEIVRELLLHANDVVCLQVDKKGRIPLHLAVMRGHVNVIMELIGARPESINAVTNQGSTVLHLCVRYNRLKALKLLLDLAPRDDSLVGAGDNNGNTVLHLAVDFKKTKIIKYLLSIPDVKEKLAKMKNKNNFTALAVSSLSTIACTDAKSIEIQDILSQADDSRSRFPKVQKFARVLEKYRQQYLTIDYNWLKDSYGHLLTTSTVIATVAFQAGVSPPGGVWQDDDSTIQSPHEAGTSIMATKNSSLHTQFVIWNTFSLATSLTVILLLISGIAFKNKVLLGILNIAILCSIIFMVLAYSVSLEMMIPGTDSSRTLVLIICYGAAISCYAVLPFAVLPFFYHKLKHSQFYISMAKWVSKLKDKDDQFYISKWVKSKLKGEDKSNPDGSSANHDHSAA